MAVPPLVQKLWAWLAAPRLMDAAKSTPDERPAWPLAMADIGRVIPYWDWKIIVSVSRRLYANMGVPRGAIAQKAMFSVGRAWDVKFEGEDTEWGALAAEWLREEWYAMSNIRGVQYDFKTDLYLGSVGVDRDGDFGILLTETADGYPLLQYVPAHRIGMRISSGGMQLVGPDDAKSYVPNAGDGTDEVRGFYVGLRIEHGVIYNDTGRPVAYRILGDFQPDDVDVSARDFIHIFDPEYANQGRGIPSFAHACNDFRDMLQSQQWEQTAQLIASSLGLQETNETGTADMSDPANAGAPPPVACNPQLTRETISGGKMTYWKAGSGSKIESFTSQRPSEMWNEFWDRLTRSALAGINWPYALIWKTGDTNAAAQRGELLKAKSSIDDRQDLLRSPARRCVGYAISKAIKLGILPPYPGKDKGGFLRWGFTMPPDISIDKGRDSQQFRANYLVGAANLTDWLQGQGKTLDKHIAERTQENTKLVQEAQKFAADNDVEFAFAWELYQQRTANANSPGGGAEAPEEDPPTPAKEVDK